MTRELLWNQEFEAQSNIPTLVIPTQKPSGDPRLVQGIEAILGQVGGSAVISDQFDYSNAGEFSIRFPSNNRSIETQILQAISDELHYWGIPTPNRFDIFDILDIKEPIVVKHQVLQRGRGVYLLETTRQKELFAQYLMDYEADLQYWEAREYIQSNDGSNNFSLRVIADMYGQIQRAFVYTRTIQQRRRDHLAAQHQNKNLRMAALFEDPDSPYFLDSQVIISNGGAENTYVVEPDVHTLPRSIARITGLPILTEQLMNASSVIAQLTRPYFPYSGLDFIFDQSGMPYFTEVNSPPGMDNGDLFGLPNYDKVGLQLAMIERILKS